MNKISDITRQDIIDIIKDGFVEKYNEPIYDRDTGEYISEKKFYMPFWGRLDEIAFFTRIYNLEAMPSYDRRHHNALEDISCHLHFGDYEDYWFLKDERFKLLPTDGDEPLLNFICAMIHPAVRLEQAPWREYVDKFNKLLQADGYELYAAEQISGRDIYKAREYIPSNDIPLLPDNLFSERYKELIQYGEGKQEDNISGHVDNISKKHLCEVMCQFAEPMLIQRNRYDNWTDITDALSEAIADLNRYMGRPVVDIRAAAFAPSSQDELLTLFFTPFIFDIIEFQYEELSVSEREAFQDAINASLKKDNVPFHLSERGLIELKADAEVLSPEIIKLIDSVREPGIHDLLKEAIEKHMQPAVQSHRDAVEKIWDALERLKTFYTDVDKKRSVSKIVSDMADGVPGFTELFDVEFETLTKVGNNYRIRHHETSKIDITDPRHYDYFFNRCLSLIALAVQYLK